MINKPRFKENDRVKSVNGDKEFVIDSVLHTGSGQGDIYKVHSGKDVYAMKIFHAGKNKVIRKQIEILQRRGKASSAFVHPLYLIDLGDTIGYVMEYVGEQYVDGYVLFNGTECKTKDGVVRMELPFNQKIAILYNIVDAVKILYDADIALMDLKFDNIKINKNDLSVKILDTDTAVSKSTKAIVYGTLGFMPPLTMRKEEKPSKYNDSYALAVMIYMTLIGGHPLIGRKYDEQPCNTSITTYTFATNPVYTFNNIDKSNRPWDSSKRIIERMKKYPQYFLNAMHKTFVDGLFDGKKRVTPGEWLEILVRLYDDHYLCKHCGEEHFYDGKLTKCNVCGYELEPPIKIVCEESDKKGIYLFNGMDIWAEDLWGDNNNNYKVFKVVVSNCDKRYGLLVNASNPVLLRLKNGCEREYNHGETIPIFMDAILKVGQYTLKFNGGKIK